MSPQTQNRHLLVSDSCIEIRTSADRIVTISHNEVLLINGIHSLTRSLTPIRPSKGQVFVEFASVLHFLDAIQENIIRINHLGVHISTPNSEDFKHNIIKLVKGSTVGLYSEESSPGMNVEWLFLSGKASLSPMFEIVLSERMKPVQSSTIPHLQVDIDTNLPYDLLKKLVDVHLGPNFEHLKVDVPYYGIVMTMGKLVNIGGIKVYLGLGTSLRDTAHARKHDLKLLS